MTHSIFTDLIPIILAVPLLWIWNQIRLNAQVLEQRGIEKMAKLFFVTVLVILIVFLVHATGHFLFILKAQYE